MSRKIYINGKLVRQEDAKISVYDHGLLYGDGVFEGIRTYGGKVFRLERAPRPAVRLGQGDLARDPDDAAGDGRRDQRHGPRQRPRRRLHPPGGHPRRRHARPRPEQVQQSASDHHRRRDHALSGRVLREGPGDRHRSASMRTIPPRSTRGSSRSTTSTTSWPRSKACRPAASKR